MRLGKKTFGVLSMFLTLAVASVMLVNPAAAQGSSTKNLTAADIQPILEGQYEGAIRKGDATSEGSMSLFIRLEDQSLLSYDGHIAGLAATNPSITGKPLDASAPEAVAYRAYLNGKIDALLASLQALAPGTTLTYRYDVVLGGAAVSVPLSQLDQLARLPNVEAIYPDEVQKIDTYRSPQFIGATSAWGQVGGQGSAGEGVVVGIIDSGIWPENPSFSDPDPKGKAYAPPPATWTGTDCDFGAAGGPADPAFSCNNKLIGAARFMDTYATFAGLMPYESRSARDDDGHGSHTASTAAGNRGVQVTINGRDFGTISGVAPRAHVAAYKVCGELGCYGTDSAAAIQQAILDGVDVLNFSISGGNNPYSDLVELAFLDAYNAGIFVAASAGNTGPGAETVNHRGPWMTTVAASTSDRSFLSTLTVNGSLSISGVSSGDGVSTPAPIVINSADKLCQSPAAAGSFAGKIVVCERGVNARVAKSANVAAGGAVGMILYNATPSSLDADFHSIPTVHIQDTEWAKLQPYLAANPGATATFTQGMPGSIKGDVLAGFSSRGGPGQTLGISKPDITAPGVNILAGYTGQEYGTELDYFNFLSGTSMSSPHIAGAAAMLADIHPDWTPGQIKSAMMTAAKDRVFKEDGKTRATPFDTGSGRVDLRNAWRPGLTFDVSGADFLAHQNDLWNANYPSIYIPTMPGMVTVQRTARDVVGQRSRYIIDIYYPKGQPEDFEVKTVRYLPVPKNGTRTFDITIDGRDVPIGESRHATISIWDGNGYVVNMPVSFVRKQAAVTIEQECTPDEIKRGKTTTCTVTMTNNSFDPADVSMVDKLPAGLRLEQGSATGGATTSGQTVSFAGSIPGATPPTPSIGTGSSPAGYLPLSLFGVAPITGVGDETATNYTVPAFTYGGQTYTRIGIVSNGYAVVGGTNGSADIQFENQDLPDVTRPNNVLAPFWTDLNPGAAGEMRIGVLTDGFDEWLILEWTGVKEYSTAKTASFQIWLGLDGDANPGEDISFTYGTLQGNGDGGFLTVGAENSFGNRGGNYYVDGDGTLPTSATELRVTSVPGAPPVPQVVSFTAKGRSYGTWTNYATMTSPAFFGTSIAPATVDVN